MHKNTLALHGQELGNQQYLYMSVLKCWRSDKTVMPCQGIPELALEIKNKRMTIINFSCIWYGHTEMLS